MITNFRLFLDKAWASICVKQVFPQLLSVLSFEGNHLHPVGCGVAVTAAKSLNLGFDLLFGYVCRQ